jgi:predicted MFS family arabinose efflux permease
MGDAPAVRSEREGKIFFGWWLVMALFVILFNAAGTGFYVFPVFISSLQAEFGWSMTQISAGVAIFAIMMGVASPVIGIFIGRYGVRRTMLVSGVLSSLAYLGFAVMQNLWTLYAVLAVSGFVVTGLTMLPAQTLVTNWFNKYRGRALGLAVLGPAAGGFLLPPFNEFLIRLWGWRFTWVFACIVLWVVVIPLVAVFVRSRPSEMGLSVDGIATRDEEGEPTTSVLSGLPVRRAVTSWTFWLLAVTFVLQFAGVSALNFHLVPFAEQEAGFTSQQAALYFGLTIGFSMFGNVLAGWLADRIRPQVVLALTGLLMAIGPAALDLFIVRLGLRDVNLLLLHAIPYGIGFGGNVTIAPVLIGRCFGELNFARISGIMGLAYAFCVLVGIPGGGYVFDRTGSYEIVLVATAIGCLISVVFSLMVQPARYHAEFVREDRSD